MKKNNLLFKNLNFSSLFWTQFFGALNDNFFKNALVILITFKSASLSGFNTQTLVALTGALFILPFFLFSPLAGSISDKFEKSVILQKSKAFEILIMSIAASGFLLENLSVLLLSLFLMGAQSAFFGPAKYSIIPQLVKNEDLTKANAFVEVGTFLAILFGTLAGGLSLSFEYSNYIISISIFSLSVIGYFVSKKIPAVDIGDPDLILTYNPILELKNLTRIIRKDSSIFNAILAISWFWFFGAGTLTLLPVFCKTQLLVNEEVVTSFLALFTIGIGIGSILCERLSFKQVEIGLVPLGSIGLTVFLMDIFYTSTALYTPPEVTLNFLAFINKDYSLRIFSDFLLMSISGGLFIVPLYTLLQERSGHSVRSRVIAANNIYNAIFMVASALLISTLSSFNFTSIEIFLAFSLLNILASLYIYSVVPDFTLRFISWFISLIIYNIKILGLENIPRSGPVILSSNHVSFIDWLILYGSCKRPARFVMHYKIYNLSLLKGLMQQAKVIPIATAKEDPEILKNAYKQINYELKNNQVVIIFPEGEITRNGKTNEFRPGLLKILSDQPVPVVPVCLNGLWGSFFSRKNKASLMGFLKGFRRPIQITFSPAIPGKNVDLVKLRDQIINQKK